MAQLWDLCELYQDPITNKIHWIGTPHTNLPYKIVHTKKGVYESAKIYPKGTFWLPVHNGVNPLDKLREGKTEKEYEVWVEGYRATGEHGTAQRLGGDTGDKKYTGVTFQEACIKAMEDNGYDINDISRYYNPIRNSFWSCRFFDNEQDARKSFG